MLVYKLPLNALESMPPVSSLGVRILLCSIVTLVAFGNGKLTDDSAYADINFLVSPFHTWMVPSQEAILPLTDNVQIAFTTYKCKT